MNPQHRLLIVDDSPGVRAWLEAFAAELGYAVMGAGSGEEAIELFRKHEADLVTLDLLAARDGRDRDAARRCARSRPACP